MNTNSDFDRSASAWLADGPTELNDRVLDAALREVHLTHQRRRLRAPWRFTNMPMLTRATASAAVILIAVVGVGGAFYLSSNTGGPGGRPTPTPATASPTPAPTASPTPAPTVLPTPIPGGPFTSTLYGYTVERPVGWSVIPATYRWPDSALFIHSVSAWSDTFEGPTAQENDYEGVAVAAQPLPVGMTADAWMVDYAERLAASDRECRGTPDRWAPAEIGGIAIRRIDLGGPGECRGVLLSDVVFVIDGTGYLMSGSAEVIAIFLNSFEVLGVDEGPSTAP